MIKDLNIPVDIDVCDTLRAPDGLALSSRNAYLSEDERKVAGIVYKALQTGKKFAEKHASDEYVKRSQVENAIESVLRSEPFVHSIEYISIASHHDMLELDSVHPNRTGAVLSTAVRLCDPSKAGQRDPKTMVRLIDNVLVGTSEQVVGRLKSD